MKKIEKLKVNMILILILALMIFVSCAVLSFAEKILLKANPVILIAVFCYLIYKILTKEENKC